MSLWFEITAQTPPALVEAVSDLMRAVAPGGIMVEEAVDILGPELGFKVRGGEPVLIRAYLPSSELGAVLTEDLRRAMEAYPSVQMTAKPLYEQDWSVSWREFFGVVDTGGRVVIVPSWIEHEVEPGRFTISLDPGQAFGTGHHETTRLCMMAIDEVLQPGMEVLDVGTGSGVLAIAAVLLGAKSVEAIDIDPLAAEIARKNCDQNGIGAEVRVSAGVLKDDHPATYDLVLSNISTDANLKLAPIYGKVTRPGGWAILSGILSVDSRRAQAAMAEAGFVLKTSRHERDWCQLLFQRVAGAG